eukprot:7379754-Prymnesium_polylepis.3
MIPLRRSALQPVVVALSIRSGDTASMRSPERRDGSRPSVAVCPSSKMSISSGGISVRGSPISPVTTLRTA